MHSDTKTIDQFLSENPNVDVSKAWERCWGILTDVKQTIASRFTGLELEPACADREYYTSPNGEFEGSFQAWSGGDCEWLVNSWLGNRKASILDMNATAYLGQKTDVPHFVMVFGTIPKLFFYFDFMPRRNLLTDSEYLDKYYAPINEEYLALRGHSNFQWSVSHGPYMRALINPSTQSLMGDLNDENIDILENYARSMLSHWLRWYDEAQPLAESERVALRRDDHQLRRLCYERDPMNKLATKVFGEEGVKQMLTLRMGEEQMRRVVEA
ncbi:hypothetical protein ACNKU7_17390 [Microbulbifer sp. SA54]|uniref:hypothetical protein n=1 Tax=Microbulbifer sp. SA54 TaxID=3401577 RepID=UPI003AAF6CDF